MQCFAFMFFTNDGVKRTKLSKDRHPTVSTCIRIFYVKRGGKDSKVKTRRKRIKKYNNSEKAQGFGSSFCFKKDLKLFRILNLKLDNIHQELPKTEVQIIFEATLMKFRKQWGLYVEFLLLGSIDN